MSIRINVKWMVQGLDIRDNRFHNLHSINKSIAIDKFMTRTFFVLRSRKVYSCVCENTRRFGDCVEDITRVSNVSDFDASLAYNECIRTYAIAACEHKPMQTTIEYE